MAALLTITVPDPSNQLQAFGDGAKVYIQRGTTDDVTDSSALTSVAIVAGTTEYEYADAAGTPGTDRYFFRYGTASPATADDYSGWTGPILAGALAGGPLNLEMAKTWTTNSDSVDDPWLSLAVRAVNRAAVDACGVDLGPSPDTSRQYDAAAVVRDGTRLWIPGGLRAFLTVATGDGTNWTTITSSVRIGPLAHSRPPGEPGSYIEVTPGQSVRLDASYFVRITATAFAGFGWEAWPFDLVQDALAAVQRMTEDRKGRNANYLTETAAIRYLALPLWHSYRDRYFPRVR